MRARVGRLGGGETALEHCVERMDRVQLNASGHSRPLNGHVQGQITRSPVCNFLSSAAVPPGASSRMILFGETTTPSPRSPRRTGTSVLKDAAIVRLVLLLWGLVPRGPDRAKGPAELMERRRERCMQQPICWP